MKRVIFLTVMLLSLPLMIFGQEPVIPDPPGSWAEVIMNPTQWFVSFGAVSILTAFMAAFFNGLLSVEKKFLKQLVAWLIAIILLVVSNLFNIGYGAEFPILLSVIHGLGAGLAANGWFDIPTINGILKTIEGWFQPPK